MAGRRPDPDPGGEPPLTRVTGALRELRWWWAGVIGADAYERYLEHHRRTHAEQRPMSEREFWRDKTDELERNPKSRCC